MVLESIFSIKEYGETHKILRIFGLKIKFPKPEFAKKKKENPYYYYKENNINITTLPPATGQLRDIQLANFTLLKELDYVCKQNNLTYWLDGGTLIGAVRHKGFIPWDDDIDTAMPRADYEKIIDAFKKSSRNPDIFAGVTKDVNNNCIIKVQHKKCQHLFVDIFPWDTYGTSLTTEEQVKETVRIKEIRARYKGVKLGTEELKQKLNETMVEEVLPKEKAENSDFVWGIDYNHQWKNWFTRYNVVYPMKTIVFEGEEFPCINNPDAFLTRVYGDYMAYPNKIGFGHAMFLDLSDTDKKIIEELKGRYGTAK